MPALSQISAFVFILPSLQAAVLRGFAALHLPSTCRSGGVFKNDSPKSPTHIPKFKQLKQLLLETFLLCPKRHLGVFQDLPPLPLTPLQAGSQRGCHGSSVFWLQVVSLR